MAETQLAQYLDAVIAQDGSDLHLSPGSPPIVRVSSRLVPLENHKPITGEETEQILKSIVPPARWEIFEKTDSVDFSHAHKDLGRFRVNGFRTQGVVAIAMRLIPTRIRSLTELNLPPILETFAGKPQGFFLVVGPVGQGKSTTLAAMVEYVNQNRTEHILTIEDPVEYLFTPQKSLIHQREVHIDAKDFHSALKAAFREDADVLMVGEMRDHETISAAVTAAETGHLVFSTLHTNDAAQTIDRIIDMFPAEQQGQVRVQLAGSLAGIFSQRLVPRISGGLIPAYELLINNNAVSNLIREARTHEISAVIQTSSQEGMIDMDRSLAELVRRGEVAAQEAALHALDARTFERYL